MLKLLQKITVSGNLKTHLLIHTMNNSGYPKNHVLTYISDKRFNVQFALRGSKRIQPKWQFQRTHVDSH